MELINSTVTVDNMVIKYVKQGSAGEDIIIRDLTGKAMETFDPCDGNPAPMIYDTDGRASTPSSHYGRDKYINCAYDFSNGVTYGPSDVTERPSCALVFTCTDTERPFDTQIARLWDSPVSQQAQGIPPRSPRQTTRC